MRIQGLAEGGTSDHAAQDDGNQSRQSPQYCNVLASIVWLLPDVLHPHLLLAPHILQLHSKGVWLPAVAQPVGLVAIQQHLPVQWGHV